LKPLERLDLKEGEEIRDISALRELIPDLAIMKACYRRESLYVMNDNIIRGRLVLWNLIILLRPHGYRKLS
jgi:hypothetical protein